MNKPFSVSLVLLSFLLISCGSGEERERQPVETDVANSVPEKPNRILYLNGNTIFKDLNDVHLEAAREIGIEPLSTRDSLKYATRGLVLVGGAMRFDEPYVVDELEQSSPFLVPEAAELLKDIGNAFQDSLRNKHLPAYSIIVTSVLRTDADVSTLSTRNINASKASAHRYGTTFDITYTRFEKHDDEGPDAREVDLKAVLTEVLRDFREQERCYIKYEVKQACFHITARKQ